MRSAGDCGRQRRSSTVRGKAARDAAVCSVILGVTATMRICCGHFLRSATMSPPAPTNETTKPPRSAAPTLSVCSSISAAMRSAFSSVSFFLQTAKPSAMPATIAAALLPKPPAIGIWFCAAR